ncbi:helix-turn-helix transcriptional regulator [Reichenbachiella sp.]|uniref:helix-turn-helix transcriptional regulator n=1 Tax=Reichenbachiella sp. TaxID=2184521 RepID=UPI003BB039B5
MLEEKSIIIGCDDTASLSCIQQVIDDIKTYRLNTISVTSEHNILGIVKSFAPSLLILGFKNNYNLLKELASISREKHIPILSYVKTVDSKTLIEFSNSAIFTFDFGHIPQPGYVKSGIKSVLRLLEGQSKPQNTAVENVLYANHPSSENPKNKSKYVLELEQRNDLLTKVKSRVKLLYSNVNDQVRSELNSIVNSIDSSLLDETLWEDFKLYFEEINPGFISVLSEKHPDLTPIDLKYCCYLKMNMSNNDIRKLLGINQESVRTHKYRLKKKMVLPKEIDLHNYVLSIA